MGQQVLTKHVLSDKEIAALNAKYQRLSVARRVRELYQDFPEEEVLLTSSFAATSALLLKVFSYLAPWQKVCFINTGYHFQETLDYKKRLTDFLGLEVESIGAEQWEHDFTTKDETWKKDPEFCCHINKVKPMDLIKENYSVWVSGLMRWQSDHRASLDIFEKRGEILKFYPLLDVSHDDRERFIRRHKLPFHPLIAKGYQSIGCTHCTLPGEDRSGRWNNNPKTECGLHL